jgi:hypothetical protein
MTTNTNDISNIQATKQDTLTAGENITIVNNVLSSIESIYGMLGRGAQKKVTATFQKHERGRL